MRFEGKLTSWNDERGFGFIEPTLGGQQIFVHIKSFDNRSRRPEIGLPVSFEVESDAEGKKRARRVQALRASRSTRPNRDKSPAQWGTASYFAILLFLVVFAVAAIVWRVPGWVGLAYLIVSVICFIAYAIDKSAAVAGRRRISESTLIFLGFAGGWPGAIIAQQLLRHKSIKAEFRSAFWGSVLLNVIFFVGISSPLFSKLST
ncbi:DUF1294 domain-containing protein [Noviherbaspirillum sp. Root189]|uniref:DUF1294 domain-containing protein n=1 Tax=Noviherbaspirillum sp. Root189 TaxID=1736487 RepID=UPI00070A7589|nr:DUF1294 domain-containing protein [Noviherbaspirillum sp. Root189]KRB67792.1 DNA-binding protein [Noviherbaspirillum sp. Root189]